MSEPIESKRLSLQSMGVPEMEALLVGDTAAALRLLECRIESDELLSDISRGLLEMRLGQLRRDPSVQPWLLRAMVDRDSSLMIGHIGFHTAPCAEYLPEIAADAVELGYTVYSSYRRRGYATEAALALMNWAYTQHGQRCFFLSVSPQNLPSMAMAESLGFVKCGSHIDEEDGEEIEYMRRFKTWPAEWRVEVGG